jgi:hypothetical protein
MKTTPPLRLVAAVGLALALAAGVAAAGPRQDPTKGYPSATPSASASELPPEKKPDVVDGHKPWVPTFDVKVPETASEKPTKEEWEKAKTATEARVTQPGCDVKRVREWYRIACTSASWMGMIGGTREGVSFGCKKRQKDDTNCDVVSVEFPARRGDRRAFELFYWSKWGPAPDAIVTEQFLEGDPGPMITVQGARWGF